MKNSDKETLFYATTFNPKSNYEKKQMLRYTKGITLLGSTPIKITPKWIIKTYQIGKPISFFLSIGLYIFDQNILGFLILILFAIFNALEYLDDFQYLRINPTDKFYYTVLLDWEGKEINDELYEILTDFKIVNHKLLSRQLTLCHTEDIVQHYDYRPDKFKDNDRYYRKGFKGEKNGEQS